MDRNITIKVIDQTGLGRPLTGAWIETPGSRSRPAPGSRATGWGWLALLRHGDVLNLVGIALLATCSVPCLLRVAPIYARARDRAFVLLCLLEVVVLVVAASGIIGAGH